jgi:hypothetical protein
MRGWRWWAPGVFALVLAARQPALADAQADFSRAVAYDLAGDQTRAFALYLSAARAGLAEAQFNVAVMFDSGRGTRHDALQAALFYAFAAVNGNARAAYNLGLLYESGDGVSQNLALARAWYRKAAEAGLVAASEKLRGSASRLAAEAVYEGAVPAFPKDGAHVASEGDFIPFVWLVPPGSAPSLFYVQIVLLDGQVMHDVLTQVVDVSATRAPIAHAPGSYAWRVFSFSPAKATYASTQWARFSISETPLK